MYCQQAGARAHVRAALREAVTAFEQALQALTHLPEDGDTRRSAIDLRLGLGGSLGSLGEYRGGLVLLGEAEALARSLEDRGRLAHVLARMANIFRIMGDPNGAITAGRQAVELAAALGESALQVEAAFYLSQVYTTISDFGQGAALLKWSIEAADRGADRSSTEVRIRAQAWLAYTLGELGAFAEARRHGEEALRRATHEGQGTPLIMAYSRLGNLYRTQGDLAPAVQVLEQGLALCRASGNRNMLRPIVTSLGSAYALQGRLGEGRALLKEGVGESIRAGARPSPQQLAWLSEACRLAGRGEEAGQYAHQALDVARQHKERANEAYALHQLGVVQAHAAPLMSCRLKPTTNRPSPWPMNSACAHSRPTATSN